MIKNNKNVAGAQGANVTNRDCQLSATEIMQLARLKRQEENEGHLVGLKKPINCSNVFITKDNPKGFFRADRLIDNILELPQSYEEDFRTFFKAISNNEKLERKSSYQYQVRNTPFKAFELSYGPYNFRENFRLPLIEGMEEFLKAIRTNAFMFDLDYDNLIETAHRQQLDN